MKTLLLLAGLAAIALVYYTVRNKKIRDAVASQIQADITTKLSDTATILTTTAGQQVQAALGTHINANVLTQSAGPDYHLSDKI